MSTWQPSEAAAEKKAPASRPAWVIACRDAHLDDVGAADVWAAMKAINVEGVEATVALDGACPALFGRGDAFSIASPAGIKRLGDELSAHGRRVSAFCLHNHFDEQPEAELKCIEMTTQAAEELGVPAVRLDIVPRKIPDEAEFLAFAIKIGKRIVKATEGSRVRFGVENHGGTTNKPEFLAGLFDGVGSKRFGLTLDTANFYWFGHPLSKLYDIYEQFAGRICHTHCKSINYPENERDKQRERGWKYGEYCCPIYQGDIDFKRLIGILRKGGYEGDLCIENESLGRFKGQEREILAKEADYLRDMARRA